MDALISMQILQECCYGIGKNNPPGTDNHPGCNPQEVMNVQKAFRGEADRLGLKGEQDVVAMIKEVRREKRMKANAGNA